MSLRITRATSKEEHVVRELDLPFGKTTAAPARTEGDDWSSRLVKLLPAEALSMYGAGQALVPSGKTESLFVLALICILFTGWLRFNATRQENKPAQYGAIAISIFSFVLWLLTLPPPAGPVDLGEHKYIAALAALVWTTVLPSLYKGDKPATT